MAKDKKSFTAYCDWKETFDSLPNEKAGQLVKHLLSYVNDENPETDDILINVAFAQIKATLKRDLKKWEEKREQNKANALKRWNKNNANVCDRIQTDAKDAVSVRVSVSDSEIIDKSITIDKKCSEKEFLETWSNARKVYRGLETHILKLPIFVLSNFNRMVDTYTIEQIKTAIHGLFEQEQLFDAMITMPTHFLENVDKYYNAAINKNKTLYGSAKKQVKL